MHLSTTRKNQAGAIYEGLRFFFYKLPGKLVIFVFKSQCFKQKIRRQLLSYYKKEDVVLNYFIQWHNQHCVYYLLNGETTVKLWFAEALTNGNDHLWFVNDYNWILHMLILMYGRLCKLCQSIQ